MNRHNVTPSCASISNNPTYVKHRMHAPLMYGYSLFLIPAQEQIGHWFVLCWRAGQYSRPKKIIC